MKSFRLCYVYKPCIGLKALHTELPEYTEQLCCQINLVLGHIDVDLYPHRVCSMRRDKPYKGANLAKREHYAPTAGRPWAQVGRIEPWAVKAGSLFPGLL